MIENNELPKAVINLFENAKKRKQDNRCGHPLSDEQEAMIEAWKAKKNARVILG